VVRSVFSEQQAFRIDHYLGKPSVQNLMALRFGNALFEPLWRRESIANIQITLAESLGVGTRGDFYDRTGALRDMIQNHALQLLTMIAMEPPSTGDADAIRDEKLKVLRSLKPFTPETWRATWCAASTAPARGRQGGARLPGGVKVPAGSHCETFVALRTEVQNWRWAGVPFYLRTGKRLAARDAQIVVNFREVPHPIFPGRARQQAGDQAAARGRAGTAPAGRQGRRQRRGAGAGVSWTWTSTRPCQPSAWAPTSACCST
jgi:glucose-6-phosphate 1-dehydrogenase